jgi:hypothetical protein
MTLRPFPDASRIRWRRLDVPGREEARVDRTIDGWRLTGHLDVEEGGLAARLRYTIACDAQWRTRSALIEGDEGDRPIRFALEADGAGHWTRDGAPVPEVAGALDVDLGFTPATNTLPIRRLALAVGESASVRSAWLRFPELRLEPLEQTYAREGELTFRYRALVDGEPFVARLETDGFGRVVRYEGLWEADVMERAFVVLRSRGPAWDDGKPLEGQADWAGHAAFMDALFEEGFAALVGPLAGTRDALLVLRASSESEIVERLAADPWTTNGLLVTRQISPWQIRLGTLK